MDEEIATRTQAKQININKTEQVIALDLQKSVLRVHPSRPQVSEENAKLSKDKGNAIFRPTMYTHVFVPIFSHLQVV